MPFYEPTVTRALTLESIHFREVVYPEDYTMSPHDHEVGAIVFVVKGRIGCSWRGQSSDAFPSSIFYIPAGETHSNSFHGAVETFDVVLPAGWGDHNRSFAAMLDKPASCASGVPTWLASRIYREFSQPDAVTPLMMEALTLELVAAMIRARQEPREPAIPRWLDRAREMLNAHSSDNLGLEQIAGAVGIHPAHLAREFRRHYRCSVGDYARKQRIEQSCYLIKATGRSLSEIALETGFADLSHFSRTFKSLKGVTPSAYRQTNSQL